ncbi:hypothetical protein GGS21DRAFT_506085 [Xylaria nigripes]|nr:hypothetical protein GGS21DRAFT_506085 [Xylaria nigripes]
MSGITNKAEQAVPGHHSSSAIPEGTHGPHHSHVANAADPRVDSDRDNRAAPSSKIGTTTTEGSHPSSGIGAFGTSGHTGAVGSTGAPHSSNVANKLDPSVESERSGHHAGSGITTGEHHQGSALEGTHGPHQSRVANAADPRVDSDRDASRTVGNTGTQTTTGTHGTSHGTSDLSGSGGPGPAPNTAGPHKHDIMNKMDPRVDSNLDGSRTVGGNKTFDA